MQKKIIALAIAAAFAAPVAMAETANVNVYGSIDGGLRSDTAAGVTKNTFGSGVYNSNRLGIKGSEDLGDGMKAFFGLESSLNTGTGAAGTSTTTTTTTTTTTGTSPGPYTSTSASTSATTNALFDRNMTVGLSSGAHSVELGRQYSVSFKVIGAYDPMGYKFLGQTGAASILPTATRYDNAIDYTGTFGDVKVMAEHTVPTTGDDALSTSTIGAAYASGAVNVGGAYSKTKVNGTLNDTAYYTIGAGFKFGDGKVSIGLTNNTVDNATGDDTVTKNQFLGASYNLSSKVGVSAAVYRNIVTVAADTTTTRMIVAATYALSKRTNLYADLDKKSADVGGDSNGASFGLSTAF